MGGCLCEEALAAVALEGAGETGSPFAAVPFAGDFCAAPFAGDFGPTPFAGDFGPTPFAGDPFLGLLLGVAIAGLLMVECTAILANRVLFVTLSCKWLQKSKVRFFSSP